MRKIREIFRLSHEGLLSHRQIGLCCGVTHKTVSEYIRRAQLAGLSWPFNEELDNEQIYRLLFPNKTENNVKKVIAPDWGEIHCELKQKGVTLQLLWYEYKEKYPEGYQYSQFCKLYRRWREGLDLVLRQDYKAGEKFLVDFAGQKIPVVSRSTGEIREAEIFVGVLGSSNYTYVEAVWSQDLPSWIRCHENAFKYFGGVPHIEILDNLKSGVTKSCRYEPDINPTFQEMASHYGIAVIPARPGKPRDKAKAEAGVLVVERWILAALRNRTFFDLHELNQTISELLEKLNSRPFKKIDGTRRTLFEHIDKPALKELPQEDFEYAEWKKARVNIDYSFEVQGHYYSVPYALVRHEVEVRITQQMIECFHQGKRVCSHRRAAFKREVTAR